MGILDAFQRRRRKDHRSVDREYVSDFTTFMERFMQEHPEVEVDQRRGRALYWDKRVDLQALEKEKQDTVPAEGYYYFAHPGKLPEERGH